MASAPFPWLQTAKELEKSKASLTTTEAELAKAQKQVRKTEWGCDGPGVRHEGAACPCRGASLQHCNCVSIPWPVLSCCLSDHAACLPAAFCLLAVGAPEGHVHALHIT